MAAINSILTVHGRNWRYQNAGHILGVLIDDILTLVSSGRSKTPIYEYISISSNKSGGYLSYLLRYLLGIVPLGEVSEKVECRRSSNYWSFEKRLIVVRFCDVNHGSCGILAVRDMEVFNSIALIFCR